MIPPPFPARGEGKKRRNNPRFGIGKDARIFTRRIFFHSFFQGFFCGEGWPEIPWRFEYSPRRAVWREISVAPRISDPGVRRNKTPQFQGSKTLFGLFGYLCNFWNPLSEIACSSCQNSDKIVCQRVREGSKRWVLWGGEEKQLFLA